MLWVIDIGNTQTVVGVRDADQWRVIWRLVTEPERTEDELAAQLRPLCEHRGLPFVGDGVMVASVVPALNRTWERFAAKYLSLPTSFLRDGEQVGMKVDYTPANAVGADRIANALAAWDQFGQATIVVDFGTATTFDVIDAEGTYAGGAILPGPVVALESLAGRTAKLPRFALETPAKAIGKETVGALQSGFMFGYAGAIDSVVTRIKNELGGDVRVVSTGGLGPMFLHLAESVEEHLPTLTLDGLVLAWERLKSRSSTAGWRVSPAADPESPSVRNP